MMLRSIAILIARVGLGVVFIAHGWQKFFTNGLSATESGFRGMGAPLPEISAPAAALIELAGGIGLVIGLATPIWALLLVADMVGAYFIAHAGKGLFVAEGGAELVLALGAGALLLAAVGAGALSVDRMLADRAPWNRFAGAGQPAVQRSTVS
ncbi:DoxX family protein [Nocardia sp. NPDC059180]|uniref:DoxX family protein n=1 Tax=Nocardia sp. NPDC059180 TaxID=3346761 RepID=UPI0036BFABEA